jgi:cytoskeletal protein CcmA (bactofilin family)
MSNDNNGQQGGDRRTSIDDGTRFKGTISSQHPVVVMGTVEGEVTAPALEVTETGVVAGRLRVTELRSRGEIAGEIDADEMQLAGRIRDKTVLRAKLLEVHLGQAGSGGLAFGDCEIVVGQVPDKAAVVAALNAALAPKPRPAKPEEEPAKAEEPPVAAKGEEPPAAAAKGEEPPAAGAKGAEAAVGEEVTAEKTDAVSAKAPRKGGRDRTAQVS